MYNQNSLFIMANPNITMSEETKKFKEIVNSYFDYNRYGYTPEKGYWLLLLLCLIRNNAVCFINSKQMSIYERAQLKVIFYRPLKEFIDQTILTDEKLYSSDCLVIKKTEKEAKIIEIAQGLGLNLSYDYHRMYRNDNLIVTFFNLVFISSKWYEENCAWAFKEILNKIDSLTNYKEYSQPREVSSLAVSLLNPADESDIYNPYSTTDYLLEFIASGYNNFYCHQTNNVCQGYIIQLAYLLSSGSGWSISNENSISHWMGERNFDYIISTPVWGVKCKESEFSISHIDYFARSSMDALHKSIGIYPASICYDKKSIPVIKELVDNDWLDTVILLPKNIFPHTSIETVLIVVNKKKKSKGKVCFMDASKCYHNEGNLILETDKILSMLHSGEKVDEIKYLDTFDIYSYGLTIHPNLYISEDKYEYPEYFKILRLGDIIEECPFIRNFGKDIEEDGGSVVRLHDLPKTLIECFKGQNYLSYEYDLSNTVMVQEPVILFAQVPGFLPDYYSPSEKYPLFISQNIKAFRIKKEFKWVSPQYVCYELSKRIESLKKRLPIGTSGSIFLQHKIAFPSENIEDQKHIVKEALQHLKLSQARELGLLELIESMKEEYMNEVRNRKHEMGAYIATLTDIHEDLVNLKVQERYIENQKELNYQCNRFEKALNGLKSLVSIFSDEIEAADVIDLNIDDYFKSLAKEHNPTHEGYDLIYKPDIDINALDFYENSNECENIPLYVEIAKEHFNNLISNIIQNAKRHGFVNRDNNHYKLEIKLSLNTEDLMFQIDFINNGTPLPKGMDKTRYGILGEKAGTTGNTGIGGNRIKNIVKLYNGDYDVFMDNDNTVIRILLPVSSKKYEQDV